MKAIWKFDVMPGTFKVEMPRGAKLLYAGLQPATKEKAVHMTVNNPRDVELYRWIVEGPRVWALVDPDAPRVKRRFVTVGTGQMLSDEFVEPFAAYVGTFMLMGGRLVFHLFDFGEVD